MLNSLWKNDSVLMVGIDIGSHSIKAVLLNKNNTGYILEAAAIEPMPIGAVVNGEIQDIDLVGQTIAKLRKKISPSIKWAASAVSGPTVITKIIYMDAALNEEELSNQIEIEAESIIPYPLDEVNIDFEPLGINEVNTSEVNVLLSIARTESIEARVAAIEMGGFDAKVVDVESYAINRTYDLLLTQLSDQGVDKLIVTIDIGATMMLFSVSEAGQHIYSRDLLFGGAQYTQLIMSYYKKSFEEAELAKLSHSLPANYANDVLIPFQMMLIQKINRAIQMFLTSSGRNKIDHIVISGGSTLIENIDQFLSEKLAINTTRADPFKGMEISREINQKELVKSAPRFMIATGLALRSFISWHI